jgi:phosphotransferase system IIA component
MSKGLTVGIIIAAILATGFWSFVMYSQIDHFTGNYIAQIQVNPGIDTINVNDQVSLFDSNIQFIDGNGGQIIQIEWAYDYMSISNHTQPLSIIITNSTNNNVLNINLKLDNPNFQLQQNIANGNVILNTNLTILMNKHYIINYLANKNVGSINITGSDLNFTGLNLQTTTGSIDLNLHDSLIQSSISMITTTGDNSLTLNNVNVEGNITANTSTGTNHISLDNTNITGNLYSTTNTGDIDVQLTNIMLNNNLNLVTATGSETLTILGIHFLQNATISTSTNTGDISLIWNETEAIGNSVSISSTTHTGSLSFGFGIPLTFARYQIGASTSTGTITFNKFSRNSPATVYSTNISDTTLGLIALSAQDNTGDITVDYPVV